MTNQNIQDATASLTQAAQQIEAARNNIWSQLRAFVDNLKSNVVTLEGVLNGASAPTVVTQATAQRAKRTVRKAAVAAQATVAQAPVVKRGPGRPPKAKAAVIQMPTVTAPAAPATPKVEGKRKYTVKVIPALPPDAAKVNLEGLEENYWYSPGTGDLISTAKSGEGYRVLTTFASRGYVVLTLHGQQVPCNRATIQAAAGLAK